MQRSILILACLVAMAFSIPAHAVSLNPTPTWMGVYGSVTFRGAAVEKGDEIRAYSPEGLLVGTFPIEKSTTEEYGFMPIYGDDTTTAVKDGAVAGDAIRVVLYRVSDKKEYDPQHASPPRLEFAAGGDELRLDLMF